MAAEPGYVDETISSYKEDPDVVKRLKLQDNGKPAEFVPIPDETTDGKPASAVLDRDGTTSVSDQALEKGGYIVTPEKSNATSNLKPRRLNYNKALGNYNKALDKKVPKLLVDIKKREGLRMSRICSLPLLLRSQYR